MLDHKKYPQIAASANYLLADIYIPDELNPLDPKFEGTNPQQESKKKKKKNRKKQQMKNESNPDGESVSVDELRNQDVPPEPPLPPGEPLPDNVEKRCFEAMHHICEGLHSAKYLQTKKFEMEEKQRKVREQHERDNPKMCKPMEPIPMPYKSEDSKGKLNLYKSKTYLENKNWHNDLKAVLFRKAFLVYITFSELKFALRNYGQCVKAIKRALNCFFAIVQLSPPELGENVKMLLAFAYGVAGDTYMTLFEHWETDYIPFVEDFNKASGYDQKICDHVEEYVDESKREWGLKVPKDVEENFFLALKCFRASMDLYNSLEGDEVIEAKANLSGKNAKILCEITYRKIAKTSLQLL